MKRIPLTQGKYAIVDDKDFGIVSKLKWHFVNGYAVHSIYTKKKVEKMAGASLTDREVVTESMAEVWEKQGNRQKAIEVYRKLSLLEPTKNAYFASKIDQLNKTK